MVNVVAVAEDRQRAIRVAFAVPETHIASAIGYLLGAGTAGDHYGAEMRALFEALATPQGWQLCAQLLRVRLELRARKLRSSRDIEGFVRTLTPQRAHAAVSSRPGAA